MAFFYREASHAEESRQATLLIQLRRGENPHLYAMEVISSIIEACYCFNLLPPSQAQYHRSYAIGHTKLGSEELILSTL